MDTSPDFNTPPSEHTEASISKIPKILPHERVFPIQIGTELIKLSGASLSSDGMRSSSPHPLFQRALVQFVAHSAISSREPHFPPLLILTGRSSVILLPVLSVPASQSRRIGRGTVFRHPNTLHRPRPRNVPRHCASSPGIPCPTSRWHALRAALRRCAVL